MKIHNEEKLNDFYKHEKLNVAVLSDIFYPTVGGVSMVVDNLCKALIETKKANVVLITGEVKNYIDSQNYPIIRTKSVPIPKVLGDSLPLPNIDAKFKKLLKDLNIDIIHIHTVFGISEFGFKFAKKYNIPIVMHGHSKYNEEYPNFIKFKPLANMLIKSKYKLINKANIITPVSEVTKNVYLSQGVTTKMKVVSNATELKLCNDDNIIEIKKMLNEKYNIDLEKDNILIFVSRIDIKVKNIEFLLNSLKILKELGTDYKFLVVGGGNDEQKMKKMVFNLGINDKVIFLGEIRDRFLLSNLLFVSKLLCFPSIVDTAAVVKYEAASQKTPMIGLEDVACTEDIINDFNGFITKNDTTEFAKKIKSVLDDKKLLQEVSENCYKTLNQTWLIKAEELLSIYNDLLKEKKN